MEFTDEHHRVWSTLFTRQLPKVRDCACREYLDGLEILDLPCERIPSLEYLNSRISPRTGWAAVRTHVRYTDAGPWYESFARKRFLVTDFMRDWHELEFTPEPDMFHDIFGHLPFFMLPYYAQLQEMFAPAYLAAQSQEEKDSIKRLAWYSTEFGMIREDGRLKVFGTGLMSGGDEFANAAEGRMDYHDFTIESVIGHDKVLYEQHKDLYVIESIDQLKAELARYFDPILQRAAKK